MKRHYDELRAYEEDAEDNFDDYNYDDEEDDFDTGFDGLEDSYDDDDDYEEEYVTIEEPMYEDDFDSYSANSIGQIDPNDRTLTVVVKNTSGAEAEAVIFGANEEAPQVAGVSVDIEESSHKEVREESKSNPFMIQGMKMSVSDPLQFQNVIRIVNRTATGSNTTRVWQATNAVSPQNFSQTIIDSQDFSVNVTGQSSLRMRILDGVTVVLTFTIRARANMGNLLKGKNVAELSRTPRTTGLPQFDLMRRKRSSAFGLSAGKKRRKVVRRIPKKSVRGSRRSKRGRR